VSLQQCLETGTLLNWAAFKIGHVRVCWDKTEAGGWVVRRAMPWLPGASSLRLAELTTEPGASRRQCAQSGKFGLFFICLGPVRAGLPMSRLGPEPDYPAPSIGAGPQGREGGSTAGAKKRSVRWDPCCRTIFFGC
jgi:hypothetical protein